MSQKIQVGRFNAILSRLLGISGMEATSEDISPEISPVLVLENDRPEWEFLAGGMLVAGVVKQLGAGGLVAKAQLRNPASSGVIAIVTQITVTFPSAIGDVRVRVSSATTDRTNAATQSLRDSRWAMLGVSGAIKLSGDNAAAAGNEIEVSGVLQNTPYRVQSCPIIVGPQSALEIGSGVADVEMDVSFVWRERPVQPYELKSS